MMFSSGPVYADDGIVNQQIKTNVGTFYVENVTTTQSSNGVEKFVNIYLTYKNTQELPYFLGPIDFSLIDNNGQTYDVDTTDSTFPTISIPINDTARGKLSFTMNAKYVPSVLVYSDPFNARISVDLTKSLTPQDVIPKSDWDLTQPTNAIYSDNKYSLKIINETFGGTNPSTVRVNAELSNIGDQIQSYNILYFHAKDQYGNTYDPDLEDSNFGSGNLSPNQSTTGSMQFTIPNLVSNQIMLIYTEGFGTQIINTGTLPTVKNSLTTQPLPPSSPSQVDNSRLSTSQFGFLDIDRTEYDVTYVNDAVVKVNGKLSIPYATDTKITIIFTLPDGSTKGSQISANPDGSFQTTFPLDSNSQKGVYSVSASMGGTVIGTLPFTVKLAPISTMSSNLPLKQSSQNPVQQSSNNQIQNTTQYTPSQAILSAPDTNQSSSSQIPMKTYQNNEYNFTIQYPSDWSVEENYVSGNGNIGIVKFKNDESETASLSVWGKVESTQQLTDNQYLNKMLEDEKQYCNENNCTFQLAKSGISQTNGLIHHLIIGNQYWVAASNSTGNNYAQFFIEDDISNVNDIWKIYGYATLTSSSDMPRATAYGIEIAKSLESFTILGSSQSTPLYSSITSSTNQSQMLIPSWIHKTAKWWSEGSVGDTDFVKGIQYLIQQKILVIPKTTQSNTNSTDQIPPWVKGVAGWWADGKISDSEFVRGMQFLVQAGIIKV